MTDISSNGAGRLLEIEELVVSYDQFRALHGVSLKVDSGEIVSIIGANGAGKSSLMKAIIGQAGRSAGRLNFAGHDLLLMTTAETVQAGIALVPEGRRLFPSLSIEENLDIGWQLGTRGAIRIEDVFRYFPILLEKRKQKARELSGGQQQMAAVGRALLMNPSLLLCDEISLGLAPVVINELYAVLPELARGGMSVVIVEQDITRSLRVADRFYCLLEGRISLSGKPNDVSYDSVMNAYFGL